MTRGTTPSYSIKFEEGVDLGAVDTFYFTIKQNEINKLTKKIEAADAEIDTENNALLIHLTQEETLKFNNGSAEVQVRGKNQDETVFATKIYPVPINRALYDEVI